MDVLKEAATKLAAMTDETKQISLATDIFGSRYGTQLLPMLKEGGAGIEALMEKAKELGIVMSTEAAADAAEFNDRITDLKESVGAIGRDIGSILIPPLIKFSEKAIEVIKNIREWADAHKPLVEMITTVTATLGVLAATGGPILMGVAAFMKLKGAMLLVKTGGISPLNVSILLITANIIIWKQVIDEVNKVLASHHTSLQDVTDAQNILAESQVKLAAKLGISVEELKEFQKNGASVSEMMGEELIPEVEEVTEKITGMNEAFAFAGEAVVGLGAKAEVSQEKIRAFGEGVQKAFIDKAAKAADAMKSLADRIYELTHTDLENSIKKLDEQKQAYIDLGAELEKVDEWYAAEISKLNKLDEPQKKVIENVDEMTDGYKELKPAIEEAGKAAEVVAEVAADSWEGFTTTIKHATTALSNFTKEGLAAAIANIKMKFRPALLDLSNAMNEFTGIFRKIAEANFLRLKKNMNDQIDVLKYGLDVYNSTVASMSKTGSSGGFTVPSYAVGTPYVPETSLAMVHKGEAIIPANQNTTNNKSTSTLNIQPGAINIVTPKFSSADGQELFRQLERQIKMRGLKLVRA